MDDPYRPPEADVTRPETVSKTGWKVFFWILLVLELLSVVSLVIDPEENLLELLLELIVYGAILLGLFGFAWGRRLLIQRYWKLLIPIALLYDLRSFSRIDWSFDSAEEMYFSLGALAVIALPLMFFQYLGLYRYAYRSRDIWQAPH